MQSLTGHRKIGLLGGTFDPVHNGHLAVARHVRKVLALDSIWFIPAAQPPHKQDHPDREDISDFRHRLAMLKLAVPPGGSFIVSDIEAQRPTPSYSIDTVKVLLAKTGERNDFSFIVGADAFLEINTWKNYRQLPKFVSFIIIPRPGSLSEEVRQTIRKNFPGYMPDQSSDRWISPYNKGMFMLLAMEPIAISSTEIRQMVRDGKNITALVPSEVAVYIREHKLYAR